MANRQTILINVSYINHAMRFRYWRYIWTTQYAMANNWLNIEMFHLSKKKPNKKKFIIVFIERFWSSIITHNHECFWILYMWPRCIPGNLSCLSSRISTRKKKTHLKKNFDLIFRCIRKSFQKVGAETHR